MAVEVEEVRQKNNLKFKIKNLKLAGNMLLNFLQDFQNDLADF